jgi:hypothetical protein
MPGKDIFYAGGKTKAWPEAMEIIRVTPDDKWETVFTGKNFVAFARSDDLAFVSDADAGKIYQVVKGGKWLGKPVDVFRFPTR